MNRSNPFLRHGPKGLLLLLLIYLCLHVADPRWRASMGDMFHLHAWSGASTNSGNTALILDGDPKPSRVAGPYQMLANQGYVEGYDDGIEDPLWVETRFFSVSNLTPPKRPPGFEPDERVPDEYRITSRDYIRCGYDRGHMAPNEGVAVCYGAGAQLETFHMTNVIPQTHALNAGLWETLEMIISKDYAERFGAVWIIDGPIFYGAPRYLKDGRIRVPIGCYKIIAREDASHHLTALAFEMPQMRTQQHDQRLLPKYLVSIDKIQSDTGITFFPDLPAGEQSALKSQAASRLW
jgi:endonuclease G